MDTNARLIGGKVEGEWIIVPSDAVDWKKGEASLDGNVFTFDKPLQYFA
jgi:hypothetical protein